MLQVSGVYELSLDGGGTFKKFANKILTGYYSTSSASSPFRVGLNNDKSEPIASEGSFGSLVTSDVAINSDFQRLTVKIDNENGLYRVPMRNEFYFSSSFAGELSSIALLQGNNIFSRALIKDVEGNPASITVGANDNLVVRYIMEILVPIDPIPVTVSILGEDRQATLQAFNPNRWSEGRLVRPGGVDKLIVPSEDGLTIDTSTGLLQGTPSVLYSQGARINTFSNDAYSASTTGVFDIVQGEAISRPFKQMVFGTSSTTFSEGMILLTLNEEVDKTEDDTLSISISSRVADPDLG